MYEIKYIIFVRCKVAFSSTAIIGLLYPCLDKQLGEELRYKREWSSVMRCVAVFVGINHASAVSFSFADLNLNSP